MSEAIHKSVRDLNVENYQDVIDVRDVIERFEELETELGELEGEANKAECEMEIAPLRTLLEELRGSGGDHQWRGDWYPVTMIRDSYFEDYAREYAEDIGAIDGDARWPNDCIDWKRAANELQMDYAPVDYDGVTYWYR